MKGGDFINHDIKMLIMINGFRQYQVAEKVGITPEWLCKLLKQKLKPEMRERILKAIEELQEEKNDKRI